MGLMESTLGESCPPGQRGGPAARGEDRAPFPDHQSFHTSIIPTGDENGNPPGRYRPAWCGSPNATGWLLIDRGLRSQRAARIFPRANVEIPPHPGRPWSGPRIINPSKISTTDNSGTKTEIPRVDTASHGVETQKSGYVIVDWGSWSQRTTSNGCKEFRKFINCHQILYNVKCKAAWT